MVMIMNCLVDFGLAGFYALLSLKILQDLLVNGYMCVGSEYEADLSDNDNVDTEELGMFTTEWLYPCPYAWPLK